MLIDSHCHLDKLDLTSYDNDFSKFMQAATEQNIEQMLCISIDLEAYPAMLDLVKLYSNISLSVGVHPNVDEGQDPTADELIALADNPRVIAIGETGLDYFRSKGDLTWQHERFANHITAAKKT
jgi:TatD DNase family protein